MKKQAEFIERLKWQEMSRLKKYGASVTTLYFGGLNTIHPRTSVLGHFRYGYSRLDANER